MLTQVSGVVVAVTQRYSVLLYANQTSVQNGTFWIHATLQTNMFLYQQAGQNVDIQGVIQCGRPPSSVAVRTSVTNTSALDIQTVHNRESWQSLLSWSWSGRIWFDRCEWDVCAYALGAQPCAKCDTRDVSDDLVSVHR